jgi:iron complex transport system ATP-binding protein
MRCVAGDQAIDAGAVSIAGTPVTRAHAASLARRRAYLPQSSTLEFGFTVFEVALLGRTPHLAGAERPVDLRIATECLEAAGVGHLRDRRYPTLSGGERQRVQFARAMTQIWDVAPERRCLILDEPTASLDLAHQHGVLSVARRLATGGTAVAVVLHDLNLAARYADRIVVLARGRVLATGTPSQVLTRELISAAFAVRVEVLPHPEIDCPLIVTIEPNRKALHVATIPDP